MGQALGALRPTVLNSAWHGEGVEHCCPLGPVAATFRTESRPPLLPMFDRYHTMGQVRTTRTRAHERSCWFC